MLTIKTLERRQRLSASCLYCELRTNFTPFASVPIVDRGIATCFFFNYGKPEKKSL